MSEETRVALKLFTDAQADVERLTREWTAERERLHATIACLDFDLAAERAQIQLTRAAIEAFVETVNAAVWSIGRGTGGQHVPYHGDFCAAGPSVLGRLEWWARNLRDALPKEGM